MIALVIKVNCKRLSKMKVPTLVAAILAITASPSSALAATKLSTAAQSLFDYGMLQSDFRWDDSYKYIFYPDTGPWSVRFTAWYTAGLLHRNKGNDVANAKAAIENILACQMTEDYESAWYGTFKLSPDEPYPTADSPLYPPEVYTTYDPNWREFVGTQLVQVVSEFESLIGEDLVSRIEDALELTAVGEMRRNGSYPAGDNLILGYSNPNIMRALQVGWIGERRNNATFIDFANNLGTELLELFQESSNSLSEYNAPSYYGMDIWGLAANIKYGPATATMTTNAKTMMRGLWQDIAGQYNPYLGNLAGPYDRAYTRDMTQNSAITSMYWWGIWGLDKAPQTLLGDTDFLYDVAQAPALALIMDTVESNMDSATIAAVNTKGWWSGSRFVNKTLKSELDSDAVRVVTSWISAPLMIGGETVAESVNRGAQFTPAIVHWAADPSHKPWPRVSFFSLYPSASTVTAVAGASSLSLSYPNTTQDGTDIFTFALSDLPPSWTLGMKHVVDGLEYLPCLNVTVDAPGLEKQPVVYGSTLEDSMYYNISYAVPAGFVGVPTIDLDFTYTC
ncbi:hypothetical protein BX600DRAFT_467327 [Xylariales sp. PMI_506]|nr:hypothetical protein BX600DRAFT_467327 [Xylariales sp. PMI_506]